MNVLLVEDDRAIADFIQRGLQGEAWTVTHVVDGESALIQLEDAIFDVVLLDLMLPGISGQDVCRKMRARSNYTPILMLTALDSMEERLEGLRVGADDYLCKPFEFDELIARVSALVRRANHYKSVDKDRVIRCGALSFDTQSLVVCVESQEIEMTARERDILKLLMLNVDRVLPRERILNAVWSAQEDPLTNIVDVYVGRLRKKLGSAASQIQTVRGVGYRLQAE